jgi:hypothetical protein
LLQNPSIDWFQNFEDALVVPMYLNAFIRHAYPVKIADISRIVNRRLPILTLHDGLLLRTTFYPFELYSRNILIRTPFGDSFGMRLELKRSNAFAVRQVPERRRYPRIPRGSGILGLKERGKVIK